MDIERVDYVIFSEDGEGVWPLYSDDHGEYFANLSDVINFTEGTKEVIIEACNFHEYQRLDSSQGGYVYVLRADNGLCKIGKARNIDDRIKQLGLILPYELELVAIIQSLNYSDLEKHLHEYFSEQRIRGEWFNLSQDDIDQLNNLAKSILSTDVLVPRWPKEIALQYQ